MARRPEARRPGLIAALDAQIEGWHPVLEALQSGRPLRKLVIARGSTRPRGLAGVVSEARRRGVPVQEVDPALLERMARTRTPQGVIAFAAAHAFTDLDEILARCRARGARPFLLLLDGIEDPGNLGAILRSAEAAGVDGVVIPRHRAVGLTATVAAASAGAIEHVPVAQVTNLSQAMEHLKHEGLWVVGADPSAATTVYEVGLSPPLAVVIGGEGRGLSRLVRERCDHLVKIPMYGRTASLNASVAAGIVLFEARRQSAAKEPRA
jgi:23S rRNA (guanosine2251-2'-O)-methyltransferase